MDYGGITESVQERAYALFDAGQIDDAITLVKEEISLSPGNAFLYILLAGMYLDIEHYGNAMEYAQAAAGLDPEGAEAYRLMGWIEFRQNRFATAFEHANKALLIKPDSVHIIYLAAWSAYSRNKQKLATELVQRGLEIDPDYMQLHVLDGIIAFTQKKYDKFDEEFQSALALQMGDPWVYEQYAERLMEIGRFHEAGEYYACAAKLDPGNKDIETGLHKSVQLLLTSSLQPEKKVLATLHPGVQEIYLAQHAKAGKLDRLPKWVRTAMIIAILVALWSVAPMIEYIRKGSIGYWVEDWLYLGAGAILFVLIAPAIDGFLIKRKSKSQFKY